MMRDQRDSENRFAEASRRQFLALSAAGTATFGLGSLEAAAAQPANPKTAPERGRAKISIRVGAPQWASSTRCNELLADVRAYRDTIDEVAFFTGFTHPPVPLPAEKQTIGEQHAARQAVQADGFDAEGLKRFDDSPVDPAAQDLLDRPIMAQNIEAIVTAITGGRSPIVRVNPEKRDCAEYQVRRR